MAVFSQKLSQPEMAALANGEACSDELAAVATAEFILVHSGADQHLVILSVRRSRIRDGGEWAEVAVQRPDLASPSWRDRLADRDDAASSAAGYAAEVRCSSC